MNQNLPVVSKARRAIATLIDLVVIYMLILVPTQFVVPHLGIKLFGEAWFHDNLNAGSETGSKIIGFTWWFIVGEVVAVWIYFVQMETSRYRGTLGKLMAGLQVVTPDGNNISVIRCTLRMIFALGRVLMCGITIFVGMAFLSENVITNPSLSDYILGVGVGSVFLLFAFHTGNRGQRLQDFFSRTRVTRRDWCPDTAEPNAILAKVSASNKVFKIVSRLLWVALFLGSALWVFYQGKTDSQPPPPIQTNAPPAGAE